MIYPIWALLGVLAGAIAGSFLGTLVLRWPEGRGVMRGRSACDECGRKLNVFDLLPVLSALLLRGRCRTCGAAIDPIHGRMEVGCAIIGAFACGLTPGAAGYALAFFGWLLLALAVLDWRHFWLPDALTVPLVFLGLTFGPWVTDVTLTDRMIGAVGGYLSLVLVALSYKAARRREGLGLGGAKLMGAMGAWLGWQALPFLLLSAALIGLMIVAASIAAGRSVSATTRIPLGTCLALAALPGWWMSAMVG